VPVYKYRNISQLNTFKVICEIIFTEHTFGNRGVKMARKRMIDPAFWEDEKLGQCKRDERLFFMGLISHADDEGYGRANAKYLKANIFPYDDDLKPKDIESMLTTLMSKKHVFVYVVEEQEFYCLPNFLKHQVINKPTESKLPKIPKNSEEIQLPEYYRSTTTPLPPKRKEVKGIEKNIIDDYFESIWKLYPVKEGKASISDTQKTELYKIGYERIKLCIDRYLKAKTGTDKKFLKQGSTFFNSGYVDYLDTNYSEVKPQEQSKYRDLSNYKPGD
jgi:hypothetical protein